MNRRGALASIASVSLAGLAGCIDAFRDHFQGELQSPIVIELYNEADQPFYVLIEGRDMESNRGTYDQGFSVIPQERVLPPHLEGRDQQLRVTRFDSADGGSNPANPDGSSDGVLVETAAISSNTQLVLISLSADDLEVEVITDETRADEERDELAEEAGDDPVEIDDN